MRPAPDLNSDLGEPVNELRIRKVLPKFRAVVLAGDGHFLMMEDPTRFNPALEAEVQAMLPPSDSPPAGDGNPPPAGSSVPPPAGNN